MFLFEETVKDTQGDTLLAYGKNKMGCGQIVSHRLSSLLFWICLSLFCGCVTVHPSDSDTGRLVFEQSAASVAPVIEKADSPEVAPAPLPAPAAPPPVKPVPNVQQAPAPPLPRAQRPPFTSASGLSSEAPRVSLPERTAFGSLEGLVKVLGAEGAPLPVEGALLRLSPLGPRIETADSAQPILHPIEMQKKTYSPRYSTIVGGDTVRFVNNDQIKHNVFSPSGLSAFDLGTFGGGLARRVQLVAQGVVKVYCNIHPEMAAFVAVAPAGLSAVAAPKSGRYRFPEVPPGSYELHVWHIRGEATQQVTVQPGQNSRQNVTVEAAGFVPELHLNKFGQAYQQNTSLFADEFY